MVYQSKLISLLLITLVLFGCASNEETAEEAYINDVVRAYETAQAAVVAGNYRRAIGLFETIQSRFPFSELSNQIQMELMYAYYKSGAKEETIDQTEAFIRENPTSPNIDYALYIQALAHFEDQPDFLERTFNKNMNMRPPLDVEKSFSILERLVTRYPASEYAADAELRMVFLKNRLASYENIVADYYIRSGAYVAALNRAKDALERYNGIPSNKESLEIMLEAYEKLGMNELANDTRSVLNQNYSDKSIDSYYSSNAKLVDNMFTSSPTSIAATNTSTKEVDGSENVAPKKKVPKFWQAIKTLLPKLPNKSN
tara:strand:- start:4436 stop:5377 length:942 start_codon:yes stop_codon:yes gene_type:complete